MVVMEVLNEVWRRVADTVEFGIISVAHDVMLTYMTLRAWLVLSLPPVLPPLTATNTTTTTATDFRSHAARLFIFAAALGASTRREIDAQPISTT
jgi:hypothetical protein